MEAGAYCGFASRAGINMEQRATPRAASLPRAPCVSSSAFRVSSHSLPHPSVSWGWQRGFIPETRVGRAGRRSEAMGWCLLRVVGGLRRGGWMWLFPCSAKVQPLLSQRCFSSCIPNRNWGLPLEIGVMEGEGSSPWGKPLSMHGGVQGDPSP